MKQRRKFLVIVDGKVSFYTTTKQIKEGVGANIRFNEAVRCVLDDLTESRKANKNENCPIGLVKGILDFQIQLTMVEEN